VTAARGRRAPDRPARHVAAQAEQHSGHAGRVQGAENREQGNTIGSQRRLACTTPAAYAAGINDSTYDLAQVNIAQLRAPLDSPLLADFVAALEPINAVADRSPGFIWRLQTAGGNATALRVFDDHWLIVNLSVW